MHTVSSPDTRFAEIAERAAAAQVRPEFEISSAPAPSRLAPHACTLTAASVAPDDQAGWESASGRFVLLHDPDGVDEWQGSFRAVIFARCEVEAEMLADPLVHEVAWSWTLDALASLHATNVGGTVTVSTGTSFGIMSDRRADGLIEVRASWTPGLLAIATDSPTDNDSLGADDDVQDHVRAWIDVLSQLAGLPPQPLGVPTVTARRARQS
ncbi:MAG TPA: DUF3000 family protein [Candidatus Nanopelagicales bacterium]|nr:DUF3000 family protein [Candidatus Nanopelagicales bacterium]